VVPSESLGAVDNLPSIVTMALPCIISDIKRDTGRKSCFFHTLITFDGGFSSDIAIPFGKQKLEWWGYPVVKKL